MTTTFRWSMFFLLTVFTRRNASDATACIYDVADELQLDLRTLGLANNKGPKYSQISDADSMTRTFSWNGCFPYSTPDHDNCSDAAACYFDTVTNQSVRIAKQDSVQFTYSQGSSVLAYQYADQYLVVFLTCRDEDYDSAIGQQHDISTYTIHIQSRCCCPGMCQYSSHSVSPVVVVIVIIGIFLSVYVIGAIVFLKHGSDRSGCGICSNVVSRIRNRNNHSRYQEM